MRDIMFRAWDRHNKVWIGPYTLKQLTSDDAFNFDKEVHPICSKFEDFDWVEFTGVFDRCKVGIFEGDIVRVEGSSLGVVQYLGCSFIIRCDQDKILLNDISPMHVEIVGNIFENSDILSIRAKQCSDFIQDMLNLYGFTKDNPQKVDHTMKQKMIMFGLDTDVATTYHAIPHLPE